jgi:flagellar export protein FliJ
MKAFRFRPESVLELRRRRRDAAQAALGDAERARLEAEADLTRSIEASAAAADAYRQVLEAGGDAGSFERHRNWIARLRVDRDRCRGVVDERQKAVDAAMALVQAAHQRVRVVERLKERARRRYDEDVRKQELKEMDHVAALRYVRRFVDGGQTRDH